MLDWSFILNPDTDNLEVDEPPGWADSSFEIQRDPVFHGVSIVYSGNELAFLGEGGDLIKTAYEADGVDAHTILRVIMTCDDVEEYREDFVFDYGTYKQKCGDTCEVSISFEEKSCFQTVNGNMEKAVDIDKVKAFDDVTDLEDYEWIKKEITLETIALPVLADGSVAPDGDLFSDGGIPQLTNDDDVFDLVFDEAVILGVRPTYKDLRGSSIVETNLDNPTDVYQFYNGDLSTAHDPPFMTPQILYDGDPKCFGGDYAYNIKFKGLWNITGGTVVAAQLRLTKWREAANISGNLLANAPSVLLEIVDVQVLTPSSGDYFDHTFTGTLNLKNSEGLYAYIYFQLSGTPTVHIEFDRETSFTVDGVTECPPSQANVYGIYETASRLIEAISNKCCKIESKYYGRTDSMPDSYVEDGCGGLRVMTSGLYIRRAEKPVFSMSMKDFLEGLRCIDNIGFALQKNVDGDDVMKIEPVDYFYQDFEMLRLPFVNRVNKNVAVDETFGIVKAGYDKWEVQSINGLYEFNSTREFRTAINNSKSEKNIISKFIAAGYVIEITRQQSWAKTGAADTKYDNDNFIICMVRGEYYYYLYGYGMVVEQGNISGPVHLVEPDTLYNFRISPARNLMRWFKSIANSYRDVTDAGSLLKFSTGTGNIDAAGEIIDDCSPEDDVIVEKDDIGINDFKSDDRATPLVRPENDTFEYPLTLADLIKVRTNPYGYISYQCGTNEWRKAFIKKISYKIAGGATTFELRPKYD